MGTKPLSERIKATEQKLLQLKAQEKMKQNRERQRVAKRTRQEDAHRKIALGGVVIAAGADHLDPAELCGLLLYALETTDLAQYPTFKKMGLDHFESRKTSK